MFSEVGGTWENRLMAREPEGGNQLEEIEVDLRNPVAAAVWAWLWPGAGHLYQRRYAKGVRLR